MNQIIGWTFTAIVVLGIGAIALVAVWPRWRLRRTLNAAAGLGIRRLARGSQELSRLTDPELRDLILYGEGCRVTAAWALPLDGGFAVTIRCRTKVPRAGGSTTKYWTSTSFVVLRSLPVTAPFTVQRTLHAGAAGRFVAGLIEGAMGVRHAGEGGLDPAFREELTVRGAGIRRGIPREVPEDPVVPPAFQEACLRRLGQAAPSPRLDRLLGEDGSLAISPHGLSLTLGQNASLGSQEEVRGLLALLEELTRALAG